MNMAFRQAIRALMIVGSILPASALGQDFLFQGWYWDYPKTAQGAVWADTLRLKAPELAQAGFTHIWLPPLSRASGGALSNGYDPQDLFDLGEFGQGPTGFGSRAALDALVAELNNLGLAAAADVVYNHRNGGRAEDNPAVAGWVRNMNFSKIQNGDQPYPSDRFRLALPIGGSSGRGAGTYYFKIASKSEHPNFFDKPYKVYLQTNTVGFQGLPPEVESEPNGGGGCGEPPDSIHLGVDMLANIDALGCRIDEFALALGADDFDPAGDTIFIYLNNRSVNGLGDYSDHTVAELYYTGVPGNIESSIAYQTYTDFQNLPSGQGAMNYLDFKPNGNPTQLAGDWDAMYFFYDYDQNVQSTRDVLFDWSRWLWEDAGMRGFRMDAVKHFPPDFVGDLLDFMHDQNIDPGLVVGEFFDGNPFLLKQWIDNVLANMDADTKAAISPRVFDFSLRFALEAASDQFGYDVRNVFNAGLVDAQGASGFNVVTFVNNHDFRDPGQPVETDPILAYAYILTNNQAGLPCVFYDDYYHKGLQYPIDRLIEAHKNYIFGATARDYLSRFGAPYAQNFTSGYDHTTLFYQLSGAPTGRDVLAAINYAGEPLQMAHGVNVASMNLAPGDTLTDVLGNSGALYAVVNPNGEVDISLPPRSYSVWVQGALLEEFVVSVQEGWNLVGLPAQVSDPSVSALFPTHIPGTLFWFDNTYVQQTALDTGKGYWLRFPAAASQAIAGQALQSCEIALNAGWNLISGPSCDAPLAGVLDPGNIIVPNTLFGFNGAYFSAAVLEAGKGYWIKASAPGTITVPCAAGQGKVSPGNIFASPALPGFSVLEIRDAKGAGQTLYIGSNPPAAAGRSSFELPPLPPAGIFDARFGDHTRLSSAGEAEILLQADHYPLNLRFRRGKGSEAVKYLLKEMADGQELAEHALNDGATVQIRDPRVKRLKLSKAEQQLPETFALAQNYPNPFNPETAIRYQLPAPGAVELAVYGLLGQKVAVLVSEIQPAGFYRVTWNGRDARGQKAASGVYIYRLSVQALSPGAPASAASNPLKPAFVQARKMLLLQ